MSDSHLENMMVFDCFNTKDNHGTKNVVTPNCTVTYFVISFCPQQDFRCNLRCACLLILILFVCFFI